MNRIWLRQIGAVVRLEVSRNLFSARALPVLILALLPVAAVSLAALVMIYEKDFRLPAADAVVISVIYQFVLVSVVYFGCVWMFINLFRGEILDRSLHYYFLAPIRRDVLLIGKFIAGWIGTVVPFGVSTICWILMLQLPKGLTHTTGYLTGSGGAHAIAYLGVTALACLGYGAVFLAIGLFLRNPIVPALVIWVIELANGLLPPLLKKISVVFYLQSLLPVPLDAGPFAFIAEPVSAFLAVPGLLIFATAVLFIASRKIRTMEIAYGSD